MEREEIVRKVAALLRLAERGGTAGEAGAAAAKAQELMDAYGVSRAVAEDAGAAAPAEDFVDFSQRAGGSVDGPAMHTWSASLLRGIARLHGCHAWRRSASPRTYTLEIAGMPSDVERVRYTYGALKRAVEGLVERHGRGMGYAWRREFGEGAAAEIVTMLQSQRQASIDAERARYAGNSTALVRVDKALVRTPDADKAQALATANLRARGGRWVSGASYRRYDPSAREQGRAAARTLDVSGRTRGALGSGK